jgi:hypothetical protein
MQAGHWKVHSGGRLICDVVTDLAPRKPYVQALATIDGRNILLDAPADHLHHHGLMFAIRANGINFWEETPGCGLQFPDGPPRSELLSDSPFNPGPAARAVQTLNWIPDTPEARCDPAGNAILIEQRQYTLGLDPAQRATCLHWLSHFSVPESQSRVELHGSSYNGLGMRFLRAMDPSAAFLIAPAEPAAKTPIQPDVSGGKQPVTPGRWAAALFDAPEAGATVLLIPAPGNPRAPARFFTMKQPFAYLSATAGLDQRPLTYTSGDTFVFEYLVILFPERKSLEALESHASSCLNNLNRQISRSL